MDEIRDILNQAVQDHMDRIAKVRGYDNIFSVCTYIDTGDSAFDEEGRLARRWRSSCWRKCYDILDQVQNQGRAVPSVEELLAELPAAPWEVENE